MDIEKKQILIIQKIKKYQASNCKAELPFNAEYFSTYANNFGFSLMKYWVNKISFFQLTISFFKEFCSCLNINNYSLVESIVPFSNFKKIILTWGNESNLKDKFFFDKYLNISSQDYKERLWIVLFSGDKTKIKKLDNVMYIVEKKVFFYKKLLNFLTCFLDSLLKKNISRKNFLFFFSWHNFFAYKILKILKPFFTNNLSELFIPYEAQPFQTEIIRYIKNFFYKTKCIGYIHSFPSFPSHLIKKKFSADKIIVNSTDQYKFFISNLGWQKRDIILTESARFRIKKKHEMSNKIYLPISFSSSNIAIKYFEDVFRDLREYNLSNFEILNHPASKMSIKHLELIKKLKYFLTNQKNKKKKIKNTSIFFGATGSVIEALFYGVKTFHIAEEPIFELYYNNIWKSIILINKNQKINKYKVSNSRFLLFGKNDHPIKNYFNV